MEKPIMKKQIMGKIDVNEIIMTKLTMFKF
jgi:hypothetical protein